MSAPPSTYSGDTPARYGDTGEIMELEHAIGFTGALRHSLHIIPGTAKYIFVAGGSIVIANLEDQHDQVFLRGHDDDITSLSLSESGRYIITGQRGRNADVCVWDIDALSIVHRFSEHSKEVHLTGISHDDSIIASVGFERTLAFFDMSNAGMITHFSLLSVVPVTDEIQGGAFGGRVQDCKRRPTDAFHFCVVTTTQVLPFQLNPFTSELKQTKLNLSSFQRKYSTVQYSSEGDLLLIGSEAGDVAIVQSTTGVVASTIRMCSVGVKEMIILGTHMEAKSQNTDGQFRYARFGPGSERNTTFFVGGGDGSIVGCEIADHFNPQAQITHKRKVDGSVTSLARVGSSKYSHTLLAGTVKGTTNLVDCTVSPQSSDEHVKRVSDAVVGGFELVVPHPSVPDRFLTASQDGVLRMWDLNDYSTLGMFDAQVKENASTITCTAICIADGLEIQLSSWSDGNIRCHDMQTFKLLWVHTKAHRTGVTALCLSPSMKYYVTGSAEGEIKIWDIRTRELKGELKDHHQAVVTLQLFADDRHLLSASKDRTVVTWDLVTMRRVTQHETHTGPLTAALLSRNQYNVHTAGMDHKMALWDLRHKEVARVVNYAPPGSESYCTCLARSSDERFLVTGGTNQVVTLWNEKMMTPMSVGVGHSGTITDCDFTADNKQVLSCGTDGALMIWNVYA